ncbi:TetR/AcrR family transcriptional regulator [Mycolicibacterium wolinskyi]|uniref:HTH tetR-type domain-containing protein n=1 Tax=Mycolicibacterium wolinskyi TaxID=59750 RepID=A0A1X2F1V9_9MYCO|nr:MULTISPECIES: TetR/AcrR family transcriptional regulator [Mycolicibacterium]MCV7287817.1 TetR/AcrR family transcriptional regulator [Mycolicibacterium wolinskyi]MCV7294715.1 TetR/AcrR family transcriptional regulator [Mycolicibacterium goodii]ORX12424.1 hypothetical protein AWC31_31035 [Mycolicibacterium wolinskyi]
MGRVKAEDRRVEFIEAAVQIIAEHGVNGATTRRIAERAEAPLATLHYCFSSKEELFKGIYEHMISVLGDSVWHVRPGAGLGASAASLYRQLVTWYASDFNLSNAQLELYFWIKRHDKDAARRAYQVHIDLLAKKLREGMRDDDDPSLIDPLSRMIAINADGILPQLMVFDDEGYLENMTEAICESFRQLADSHRLFVRGSKTTPTLT